MGSNGYGTLATGYSYDYRVREAEFKTLVLPLDHLIADFKGSSKDAKFLDHFASHMPKVLVYLKDNVESTCGKETTKARPIRWHDSCVTFALSAEHI